MTRQSPVEPAFEDGGTQEPLTDVLAGATATLASNEGIVAGALAVQQSVDELVSGMAQHADANRSPESNGFTYDGHTEGEAAFVNARIVSLETAIADYNREITAATGNAAAIITMVEANRDDLVERFSVKRENAIRSIESLKAQMRILGQ